MGHPDQDIIAGTLNAWTKGLNPSEKHISVFNHIRDIPYALVPELMNYAKGPEAFFSLRRGSCSPKHFLLGRMFQILNIPIRYVSFPFSWEEQPLALPAKLKVIASGLPLDYHLACKAYLDDKWCLVDATWDLPLKSVGAPVNEQWDGKNETENAVIPLENIVHENAEARMKYVFSRETLFSDAEKNNMQIFIREFNDWLEKIRLEENER